MAKTSLKKNGKRSVAAKNAWRDPKNAWRKKKK